jgi:hypothetical protein
MERNRGVLLSIFLILFSLLSANSAYGVFLIIAGFFKGDSLFLQNYLDSALSVILIISVIGLWFWKRWSIYLFFIGAVVNLLTAIFTVFSGIIGFLSLGDSFNFGIVFYTAAGFLVVASVLVIFWLVLKRKLLYFN